MAEILLKNGGNPVFRPHKPPRAALRLRNAGVVLTFSVRDGHFELGVMPVLVSSR